MQRVLGCAHLMHQPGAYSSPPGLVQGEQAAGTAAGASWRAQHSAHTHTHSHTPADSVQCDSLGAQGELISKCVCVRVRAYVCLCVCVCVACLSQHGVWGMDGAAQVRRCAGMTQGAASTAHYTRARHRQAQAGGMCASKAQPHKQKTRQRALRHCHHTGSGAPQQKLVGRWLLLMVWTNMPGAFLQAWGPSRAAKDTLPSSLIHHARIMQTQGMHAHTSTASRRPHNRSCMCTHTSCSPCHTQSTHCT